MPTAIDYTNQKIGRLKFLHKFKNGTKTFWKVECDCGNKYNLRSDYIYTLKSRGSTFECTKCKFKRRLPIELNSQFGRLTVVQEILAKDHHRWFLCICECGKYSEVPGIRLCSKKHPTRSCGCLSRKLRSKWANTTQYPPSHGFKKNRNKKTMKHRLYGIRSGILSACYKKNDSRYLNYGEKGCTVCDLWRNGAKEFVKWALVNGYEKGSAIVLKDEKKEFGPTNCQVVSKYKYIGNKNATFIEYNGRKKNISEWASELGCTISCLSMRLRKYSEYGIEKIMNLSWIPKIERMYVGSEFEQDIVKLYKSGSTYKEITEKLGCGSGAILRFLEKNGIKRRPAKTRSSLK